MTELIVRTGYQAAARNNAKTHTGLAAKFSSFAAFCYALVAIASPGAAQMTLPGKLEAQPSGGVAYSIPITVPPGTAGLTPALSLTYDSQRSSGLMGMGWSVADLPAISRCARTVPQDGVRGGINYDGNDRFCLDGQRLVVISGAYGGDGAEYRTEREGFSKIVSYGSAGGGPAWFKVWSKSGQIMELGNTADSRVEAQGKAAVRVWAVNKIQDTVGNYLTVSYAEDNASGDYRPARIDYTGNTTAGVAPYASVRFQYEARPDIVVLYSAGSMVKTQQRLNRVQTFVGENLVLDYRLAYDLSPATQRSRLTSVAVCAADGSCLPATTFNYENAGFAPGGNLAFATVNNPIPQNLLAGGDRGLILGDWNGDGFTDMMWWDSGGSNRWFISNGAPGGNLSFATYIDPIYDHTVIGGRPVAIPILVGGEINFGDWNGDGITDIMWWNPQSGENRWFISNGAAGGNLAFTQFKDLIDPITVKAVPMESCTEFGCTVIYAGFRTLALGDWNGDGVTDALFYAPDSGDNFWYISNRAAGGSLSFTPSINPIPPADAQMWVLGQGVTPIVGDWNGDGFADLLLFNNHNQSNYWFVNNGGTGGSLSFVRTVNPIPPGSINQGADVLPGDWNGDGLTDLVLWHKSSGDNRWIMSKGGVGGALSFDYFINANPSINLQQGDAMPIGDWNGDGVPDMVWWNKPNGANHWFVTNPYTGGMPSFPGYSDPIALTNMLGGDEIHAGDWNGDGITDLMWWEKGGGNTRWFIRSGGTTTPDVLKSVGNGLGEGSTISYDLMSKGPPFYTRDTGLTWPIVNLQGGMYAVSRVDTTNGIGGVASQTYRYTGAKLDVDGRGFLGFRIVTARDEQTTIETTTTFRQDWPFLGMPAVASKTYGALELSRSETSYAADDLDGIRRFVRQTQNMSSSRDLDGSVMPTVTTSYTYDAFGNATVVTVTTSDGYSKTTTNTYTNDTANWFLGRLTRAATTSIRPD